MCHKNVPKKIHRKNMQKIVLNYRKIGEVVWDFYTGLRVKESDS